MNSHARKIAFPTAANKVTARTLLVEVAAQTNARVINTASYDCTWPTAKMWSAFESNGVLAPAVGRNSQSNVFQMMWNNAFASLVGSTNQVDESLLHKQLCASSLLQQALSILSRRESSITTEVPVLPKLTGKSWWWCFLFFLLTMSSHM